MSVISFITGMLLELIVYSAVIVIFSFTIWMFVDAAKQDRFWWIVIIAGIPCIGAAAYYLTEKKHEYVKAPSHHIHESETEAQHETSHPHHEHRRKGDIEPAVLLATASHESENEIKKESKEEGKVEKKEKKDEAKEIEVTEIA